MSGLKHTKKTKLQSYTDTMWDGTKKLAHKIADEIAKQSPDTRVKIFNISKTNKKRHHDRSIQIKSDCRWFSDSRE